MEIDDIYRTLLIVCCSIHCCLCIDFFLFKENGDAHINLTLQIEPASTHYVHVYDENNTEIFRVKGTTWQAFGSYTNRIDFQGNTHNRDMTFTLRNASSDDAGNYRAYYKYSSGNYIANDYFYLANGIRVYAVEQSDATLYWNFTSHTNRVYARVYNSQNSPVYQLLQPARDDVMCAVYGCFRGCLYDKYIQHNEMYRNGYFHVTFIVKEVTTVDAGLYYTYSYTHISPYKTITAGTKLVVYRSYVYVEENASAILQWNTTHIDDDYVINQSEEEILFIQNNEVRWSVSERFNYTGNITDGYMELRIEPVKRTDEGIYSLYFGSTGARLVVYVAPETPYIIPDSQLIPRSSITLKCISKSNTVPTEAPPIPMYYTWFVDNRKITNDSKYMVVSSRLTIRKTEVEDLEHKFTCQAEEVSSKPSGVSSAYILNVKFPPLASLKPPNKSYATSEGDKFYDVTCFAKCSPECKYVWTTPSDDKIYGPTLSLGNLNRRHHGTYTCTASNEIGEDAKEIYVNVQYYVTITASSAAFSTSAISMIAVGGALIIGTICAVVFMKCRAASLQARKPNLYETKVSDVTSEENKEKEIDVYDNLSFTEPIPQIQYDEIQTQEPKQNNNTDQEIIYEVPAESPSDGYEPVPPIINLNQRNHLGNKEGLKYKDVK